MSVPRLKTDRIGPREISLTVNRMLQGGLNNTGRVELSASATTTDLLDSRIGGASLVLLMPETAAGAAALAQLYVTNLQAGRAQLVHPQPAAGRRFRYAVFG